MFCKLCGGPLKPDAQFCPHCGAARIEPAVRAGGDGPSRNTAAAASTKPGRRMNAPRTRAIAVGLLGLVVAVVSTAVVLSRRTAQSGTGPGCRDESVARSVNGPVDDMLTVTNLTTAPVDVHWINFAGGREKHFEVAPQGTRRQRTPARYPWVITNAEGKCLQLVSVPATVVIKE